MSLSRVTTVFWYHVRRVLGWGDKDRIALLFHKDHALRGACLVRRVPTEPGGFNLPRLEVSSRLGVRPHHATRLPPSLTGSELPESEEPSEWRLLASGHAREVIVVPQEVGSRNFELTVGELCRAKSPGEGSGVVDLRAGQNDVALAL